MKYLIFAFYLTILLIGCGDKKNNFSYNQAIIGKWKQSSEYTVFYNNQNEVVHRDSNYLANSIQYNTNGTLNFKQFNGYMINGFWEIKTDTLLSKYSIAQSILDTAIIKILNASHFVFTSVQNGRAVYPKIISGNTYYLLADKAISTMTLTKE